MNPTYNEIKVQNTALMVAAISTMIPLEHDCPIHAEDLSRPMLSNQDGIVVRRKEYLVVRLKEYLKKTPSTEMSIRKLLLD